MTVLAYKKGATENPEKLKLTKRLSRTRRYSGDCERSLNCETIKNILIANIKIVKEETQKLTKKLKI